MSYNNISNLGKYFRLSKSPPIFIKGENEILIDKNNKKYLDFACGSGTTVVGHNNKYITENLKKIFSKGFFHSGPHFLTNYHMEYIKKLKKFLNNDFSIFNLATNGSEASETALKLSFHHSNRNKIIYFDGSYHGRTGYSLSSSGMKGINKYFFKNKNFISCKFNSISDFKNKFYKHKDDLAAVIIEPIQGTSGFVYSEKNFLKEIRKITSKNSKLLIFDEVWTGFGKTGYNFAYNYYKITPDILILGKSLGNGFPLGIVAFSKKVKHDFPGAQSSTFQGNIISISSSLIFMKYLQKIDYLSKIKKIEKLMATETNNLKKFKFVKEIRGIGFMWGIEINNSYFSKKDFTNTIRLKLLRNNLITWESGFDSNVICLVPPITISISSIKSAFKIINKTFYEIDNKYMK